MPCNTDLDRLSLVLYVDEWVHDDDEMLKTPVLFCGSYLGDLDSLFLSDELFPQVKFGYSGSGFN
jgi:hypothetical protein